MSEIQVVEIALPSLLEVVELVVPGNIQAVEIELPSPLAGMGGTGVNTQEIAALATVDGEQTFSVPAFPAPVAVTEFYINGVRQNRNEAQLVGTTITLPLGLNILMGDFLQVIYSHA